MSNHCKGFHKDLISSFRVILLTDKQIEPGENITEGLRERTEHLYIFLFFCPSLNGVLFPMFCSLVERECQILVF